MKRIRILPGAEKDLDEIAEFIARDNLEAALGLYSSADAAFRRLAEMPEIGATRTYLDPRLSRLRMWPIPHYENILVYCEPLEEEIRKVRVLHSARDISGIFGE